LTRLWCNEFRARLPNSFPPDTESFNLLNQTNVRLPQNKFVGFAASSAYLIADFRNGRTAGRRYTWTARIQDDSAITTAGF